MTSCNYPDRPKLFALHFIKWLADSETVQEIGPDAFALLVAVVTKEDDIRYSRAVNFYNEQLAQRCGILSVHALTRARNKAVEAGLLIYEPSVKRRPGRYFVTGFHAQSAEQAGGKREESVRNPLPSSPNPIPNPNPHSSSLSKLSFDDEDESLANFILDRVRDVAPKVAQPNIQRWANTIRLMRVRDNRTLGEIRDLFVWANTDHFWRSNILSVDKLRQKFGELDAKRSSQRNGSFQPKPRNRVELQ